MPVQGTTWRPVSSETRREKPTSRPPNIPVGSQIVFTPRSTTARALSTATPCSSSGPHARGGSTGTTDPTWGHQVATASSR